MSLEYVFRMHKFEYKLSYLLFNPLNLILLDHPADMQPRTRATNESQDVEGVCWILSSGGWLNGQDQS